MNLVEKILVQPALEREVESKDTEGGREKGREREGEGCLHVT